MLARMYVHVRGHWIKRIRSCTIRELFSLYTVVLLIIIRI